jgi:hypothetical protein
MSSDAPIQADPYLSSKEAGQLLGYTHDYISKLCRDGKMAGIQRGRVWYVTEEEARAFQARHEAELEQKKAQLSEKFSAIRQQHESQRGQVQQTSAPVQAVAQAVPVVPQVSYPFANTPAAPARTEIRELIEDPYLSESDSFADEPVQKKIEFVMPKHVVAAAVLALLMLIPSLMQEVRQDTKGYARLNASDTSSVVDNLDEGVASVISAQADLVSRTANTFSFVQYLGDGYWQLATSATELCAGFYRFLSTISDSYLAIYVMQGEIIYDSFGQIGKMGATVLQGYELLGESFVVGGQNIVESYKDIFMVDSYIESLKKN